MAEVKPSSLNSAYCKNIKESMNLSLNGILVHKCIFILKLMRSSLILSNQSHNRAKRVDFCSVPSAVSAERTRSLSEGTARGLERNLSAGADDAANGALAETLDLRAENVIRHGATIAADWLLDEAPDGLRTAMAKNSLLKATATD